MEEGRKGEGVRGERGGEKSERKGGKWRKGERGRE